jgi:transglutaminase-like putative cysteine protease
MELRMTPKTAARQTLRGFALAVGPMATLLEHVDWLGNRVHQFSVVAGHDRIVIVAESCVETLPFQPGDLKRVGGSHPVVVDDHRLLDFLGFEGPIVRDPRLDALAKRLGIGPSTAVGDVVDKVQSGLREVVHYKKGITGASTGLAEVLDRGAGVCQDLSHVAIGLFRSLGIPARYVSGYLHRGGGDDELETHAWVEAHVPSLGFVAFDPTHASGLDESHVAVAVGRSFADVPPNRGVYRGDASETIRVSVHTEEVTEVPKGLLTPRAARMEEPSFDEGPAPAVHREGLDYQQEQEQQQQQQQQ